MPREDGRQRVVIEHVTPEVDGGRFSVKRVVGETLSVEADVFCDGHDLVAASLLIREPGQTQWQRRQMSPVGNDRFVGKWPLSQLGEHLFTVEGWIDRFATWRRDLEKRLDARQDVKVALEVGRRLLLDLLPLDPDGTLAGHSARWEDPRLSIHDRTERALDPALALAVASLGPQAFSCRFEPAIRLWCDRERGRFSTWYELFPRSLGAPGKHGRLSDVAERLPYVSRLGFDVLYLPPIHPIGTSHRKGKNNQVTAEPGDVGSLWAIGNVQGGHDALHPDLGTLDEFRDLVRSAQSSGMELAIDLALQCSPDHPYVEQHPEWFKKRPDGTIQSAENPPKKYQDIYPLDFECEEWSELWQELRRVVLFWMKQGIEIFRVDNPHTKPFPFWEWLIEEAHRENPRILFLAEAFTRPKVMQRLAKLGFSQSYTYFTWRNTSHELTEYFSSLTQGEERDYFRPNLWPNTPDILPESLQIGGRAAFTIRVVLAATLGASYGIYGPAFELGEHQAREPGGEEYLDSEKYQLRTWNWDAPHSLGPLIERLNRVRREHPALQQDRTLTFHSSDNDQILAYSKTEPEGGDVVLVVVSLDAHHRQSAHLTLDLARLGLDEDTPYQVHDLLGDARFLWHGRRNFVELSPDLVPAHVFAIRRRARSERDFDYFR